MERFTANSDGTVTDNVTGLMWQQDAEKRKTWQETMDYANSLELGGYEDWRLPTINELLSIVDYNNYNPAIDTTAFPNTHLSDYWSSTIYADNPSLAWGVYFGDGDVYSGSKTYNGYARCVREVRAEK